MQRVLFEGTASAGRWFILTCLAVGTIVMDRQTDWLDGFRSILSAPLQFVHTAAELPAIAVRGVNVALEPKEDIKAAYDLLQENYAGLRAETLRIRALEKENQELRELLDATESIKMVTEYASVRDISVDGFRQQIVVDRGLTDGVYEGQVVIDETGIVGLVTRVMVNSALVTLLTDGDVAIPLMFERSGVRTMGIGQGGANYTLRLPFLTRNNDIREGDRLVSSGMGGRYPEGYPVAEVESITERTGQSFLEVVASPVVQLDKLAHVLLLSVGREEEQ